MPRVALLKAGTVHEGEIPANANLVVRAGIKQFPFPHLTWGCGMGKCGKCACRVLSGADDLPAPNWKELRVLGDRIPAGYRLMCQLWLTADLKIEQ